MICVETAASRDLGPPPRVVTVVTADLELATRERPVLIMSALLGLGVVPETRSSEEGTAVRVPRAIVGEELLQELGSLSLESVPGFLTDLFEDVIKGRTRDDLAARAAVVA